jgi:23S rRNA (cytosine1962-C5)-methyltransferase
MLTAGDQFVGYGLWDPSSALAVRVYGRERGHVLELSTLVSSVTRAIDARDGLLETADTTAYRLCNGEGDRVPGVVLDRYGPVVIAKLDGEAIAVWAQEMLRATWPRLAERGVTTLALRGSQRGKPTLAGIAGDPVPPRVVVVEHGMRMAVDLLHGQKTGAFLDQRENRRRVRWMSSGARVLNLFSYAGGFSCAAALGGARHVTSVDIAHPAHAVAQENFRLNGIEPSAHAFVTSDVFAYLEAASQRNDRFDLVISDPPSFAPNEKSLPRALAAYRRLHEACAQVVARGGTLCTASCSSHVDLDAFLGTLDDGVLARRSFRVLEVFGQPPDHPTLPSWPEGRYLKFVVLGESLRTLTQRFAS